MTVLMRKRIAAHRTVRGLRGAQAPGADPALFAGAMPLVALFPGFREQLLELAVARPAGWRIGDPKVETRSTCMDSKRQWRHSCNVWHNSMVRSVLQTLAAPVTGLGHLMRGSKSGMKSQPNG